jgi:hypothetical protein
MENNISSKTLCAIIVSYRSLGILKEESRNAMIELMVRKENGDDFDFEDFINKELEKIPKNNFDPKVISFLKNITRNL